MLTRWWGGLITAALIAPAVLLTPVRADVPDVAPPLPPQPVVKFIEGNCLDCHSRDDPTADIDLETAIAGAPAKRMRLWEQVATKLRSRQMPPGDSDRPDERSYRSVLASLEGTLDALANRKLHPGRTETLRRLTRTEYQNAIRDLLDLQVDASTLLPKDESSQGFDNITVGELTPTLLNRYISAAQKISKLAVGGRVVSAGGQTIRMRPDITQEKHVPGLPIGTRGGALIEHVFPQDGEYEIRVRLARDRNEHVEGLRGAHEMEVLLNRRVVESLSVRPPAKGGNDHSRVDAHLTVRCRVTAGPHQLGVTFVRNSASLQETSRQPYQTQFNMHRHPRQSPAVYQVSITGPFATEGPGDTPSRRRIFICRPTDAKDETDCAEEILTALARRAWRRPVSRDDLQTPRRFFRAGREDGSFEWGIQAALESILVDPRFLFRIERDPPDAAPGTAYDISDLELASRLSFFLWSSLPDEELLATAERGELRDPQVLRAQVDRMLADRRSESLVTNFAAQWLYLRNLESVHPDMRLYPDFDHNLRTAMRRETEMFFASVMREDRSVLDLLRADYTYLNERLAKHYGIPHIYGSRFRKVKLLPSQHRGGLLRHGSLLTVTSYATRTSPVIRGHWILKNLIGSPPPPPPPDVPDLKDNTVAASLPLRARLAQHRSDPNCAGCHRLMDPVGFSLENYDAVGRWRKLEAGLPVDARGGLPDGSKFDGVAGLENGLVARPELFVGTLSDRLLTYALGRGLDYRDAPAIRQITREAREANFRFSSIIQAIVASVPFRMRTAE